MSTTRDQIVAAIATVLSAIDGVGEVEQVVGRDPRSIGVGRLPWIGVGPSPERQPAPVWAADLWSVEEVFTHVQAVVLAAAGSARQVATSDLAEAIVAAIMADPTLGGVATSTISVMGPWADDCSPEGDRATFHLLFRSTYPKNWRA